jgi:hypothetical protein
LAIDKKKKKKQGYSLPEQEHKEMDRPPGTVADLRIQGQQVHSYKKQRRPNNLWSATTTPTSIMYVIIQMVENNLANGIGRERLYLHSN